MYSIWIYTHDVVLCCAVQRLACYERSDFLKVTHITAKNGYGRFNCSNERKSSRRWNYRGCWHHAFPL